MMAYITAGVLVTCIYLFWEWLSCRPFFSKSYVTVSIRTSGPNPYQDVIEEITILNMRGDILLSLKDFDWKSEEMAVASLLNEKRLVGHNINFVRMFLMQMFERFSSRHSPHIRIRGVDVATLVFEHLAPILDWKNLSPTNLARAFWPYDFEEEEASASYIEAEASRRLAHLLLHSTFFRKIWWRWTLTDPTLKPKSPTPTDRRNEGTPYPLRPS